MHLPRQNRQTHIERKTAKDIRTQTERGRGTGEKDRERAERERERGAKGWKVVNLQLKLQIKTYLNFDIQVQLSL